MQDNGLRPGFSFGVLTEDGMQWVACAHNYMFPEKALARVFKGKFMDYLRDAATKDQLIFPGKTKPLGTKSGFKKRENSLWSKDWVVDIQDPIDKPEHVLEYVGRYTHRVAISNNRMVSLKDGKVTFTYKDRKQKTTKTMTIDAVEFIRRFLLHALPNRFMRIRHIGFLANRCKKESLKRCRELLNVAAELFQADPSVCEMMFQLTGKDIFLCHKCKKGRFEPFGLIPKQTGINPFYVIHSPITENSG